MSSSLRIIQVPLGGDISVPRTVPGTSVNSTKGMNEFTNVCDGNSPSTAPAHSCGLRSTPIYLTAQWTCVRSEAGPYLAHCLLSGGGLHSHSTGEETEAL